MEGAEIQTVVKYDQYFVVLTVFDYIMAPPYSIWQKLKVFGLLQQLGLYLKIPDVVRYFVCINVKKYLVPII